MYCNKLHITLNREGSSFSKWLITEMFSLPMCRSKKLKCLALYQDVRSMTKIQDHDASWSGNNFERLQ